MAGGGIIETRIHDALRNAYKEDPNCAEFVNNIKPKMIWDVLDFVSDKCDRRQESHLIPAC